MSSVRDHRRRIAVLGAWASTAFGCASVLGLEDHEPFPVQAGVDGGGSDEVSAGGEAGAADASSSPAFGDPVILAKGLTDVKGMGSDANDVFLTMASAGPTNLRRATRRPVSATGAAVTILDQGPGVAGTGLVVATKGLYWPCYGGSPSLCFVDKGGSGLKVVNTGALSGWDRGTVYGASLYLFSASGTWAVQDDLTGLVRLTNATGANGCVDASSIYVTANNQILRIRKEADAGLEVVADAQLAVRGLALDATTLYWALEGGQVLAIDKTATVGTPRVLASGQAGPSSIAIDTDSVYFTNGGDGTVVRVPKAGGPTQTVASGQSAPRNLRADDAGLVWLDANGDLVGALKR